MRYFILALSVFFSIPVFALEKNTNPPDLAVGTMLASLLLVIVCIFIFAYLLKKTNLLKNAKGISQIKVIATQPLTNKGRVQIIEINGQHYLLGVTEQNITLLDKFEKPLMLEKKSGKDAVATPFATLLSKISKKSDE